MDVLQFTAVIDGLPVFINPRHVVLMRKARADDELGVPIHDGTLIVTISERETVVEDLQTVVSQVAASCN